MTGKTTMDEEFVTSLVGKHVPKTSWISPFHSAVRQRNTNRLMMLLDNAPDHVALMSFVFVIGPTERTVLASYTMVVPARLQDQFTGGNSQSELVIPNWL